MSLAAVVAAKPGLASANVLVLLFAWNAFKFAWAAVLSILITLRSATHREAARVVD